MSSMKKAAIGLGMLAAIAAVFAVFGCPFKFMVPKAEKSALVIQVPKTHYSVIDQAILMPNAYADEVVPAPVVGPSIGEKIEAFLKNLADHLPGKDSVVMIALLFVYDFVRRKWPTSKPASLWKDVKAVLNGLKILIEKIDAFGDSIFGQSIK